MEAKDEIKQESMIDTLAAKTAEVDDKTRVYKRVHSEDGDVKTYRSYIKEPDVIYQIRGELIDLNELLLDLELLIRKTKNSIHLDIEKNAKSLGLTNETARKAAYEDACFDSIPLQNALAEQRKIRNQVNTLENELDLEARCFQLKFLGAE